MLGVQTHDLPSMGPLELFRFVAFLVSPKEFCPVIIRWHLNSKTLIAPKAEGAGYICIS